MNKVKVVAMYLPQFHSIPENDLFWGKGFTDWMSVQKALPLFNGHKQPCVPQDKNYYDLSKKENVAWQVKIAKDNGIYGFAIYHYWFNNEKNLLTKPTEIILENKEIDINYFYAWDNTSWKRSWSNVKDGNAWAPDMENSQEKKTGPAILIPYILGNESDWKNHYDYLYPYFKDSRYIKINNKPVFTIYHYCENISKMCDYWDKLAKEDGFDGMFFIFRYDKNICIPEHENVFKYEPIYSGWSKISLVERVKNKLLKIKRSDGMLNRYNYHAIWKNIIKHAMDMPQSNVFHGAFVSYDDTPRRGRKGIVVENSTPANFKRYMSELINISKKQNKEFIFLTAWNEWGEGAYLEPDTNNNLEYLSSLKDII